MKQVLTILTTLTILIVTSIVIYAQDSTYTSIELERKDNASLGIATNPDGSLLIAGGGPVWDATDGWIPLEESNNLTVWDMENGEILRQFETMVFFAADIAITPDGEQVIAAWDEDSVGIWDIESGELLHQYDNVFSTVLDLSPDGSLVISSQRASTPILWDFESGEILYTFSETIFYAPVAFSPNNTTVAVTVGADDEKSDIILWNTETMSEISRFEGFVAAPDIEFSPDGTLLAVATVDNGIQIFGVDTGEIVSEFPEYVAPDGEAIHEVASLAFSADGSQLLSSWGVGYVVLWDIETREATHVGQHEARVWRVIFSPDGVPISSSYDGSVNMWIQNS